MFKISDFLERARQKKKNVFFICDAAQVSEEIAQYLKYLKTYENHVEVLSLFSGTKWGNAPLDCSPLIFDFRLSRNVEEYEAIETLLNNSETMHVVYTDLSIVGYIKQQSKYLTMEIEGEEGSYLFRWFDPRILKFSNVLFTNEQWKDFYNNIDSWEIIVRNLSSTFILKNISVWSS